MQFGDLGHISFLLFFRRIFVDFVTFLGEHVLQLLRFDLVQSLDKIVILCLCDFDLCNLVPVVDFIQLVDHPVIVRIRHLVYMQINYLSIGSGDQFSLRDGGLRQALANHA